MSTNSQDQEIDLGQIGAGIKKLLNSILNTIFDFIFFIKKKIVIIGGLLILGVIAAFGLDSKSYNHEISVIPNFGSNEYLYKKIEQIDTKLREKDENFFNEIGLKNFEKIKKIVKFFNKIYNFLSLQFHKLLSLNRDHKKLKSSLIKSILEYGNW